MANLVKYGSYSLEAVDKETKAWESSKAWMKLAVGVNVVRFLPPPMGKESPFRVIWTHYLEIPGLDYPVTFACPRREANKPCPVCAQADEMKTSGNDVDYERAKAFFARRQVYANVIDRKDEDAGPKILRFGKTIHDDLRHIRKSKRGGDFCDPVDGFDISIEREGTTKTDTDYHTEADEQCALCDDAVLMQKWIDGQADLENLVIIYSPEEITAKLQGQGRPPARDDRRPGKPRAMANEGSRGGPRRMDAEGSRGGSRRSVVEAAYTEVVDDDEEKLPY